MLNLGDSLLVKAEIWHFRLWPLHKAMPVWSLQQNEMLNKVNSNDNILPPPTTDEYCGTSDECSPPQDRNKLMIVLKYIRNKK